MIEEYDAERSDAGKRDLADHNTESHRTAFTISVDLLEGTTTGISAADRAATLRGLADPTVTHGAFARPGHIFPLRAREGGVLKRAGHTEAAVDLARMAGCEPAGIICEIQNDDGTMSRLPDLLKIAKKHKMKIVSIKDLIEYRMKHDSLIKREVEVDMPTKYGHFRVRAYSQDGSPEPHLAIIKGSWKEGEPVLVRVHSSCLTGDIMGSMRCDCGDQIEAAMTLIAKSEAGVLVYQQKRRCISSLRLTLRIG